MSKSLTYHFKSLDKNQITSQCSFVNLNTECEVGGGKAFWDTGSTVSIISEKVVNSLKINPILSGELKTASGVTPSFLYELGVYLKFDDGQEIEKKCKLWSLKLDHCDILIGMDIILMFDFIILPNKEEITVNLSCPPKSLQTN